MIIHIGTNDVPGSTSREIQDNLLNLESLVNEKLPQCKVSLSTPTLRPDNGKATLIVPQLVNHLLILIFMQSIIEISKTDILVEKVYI